MKLHTKQQAPKEGEAVEQPKPKQFNPSKRGYLQFLAESKAVYDAMEKINSTNPTYAAFANTGLERGPALAKDIAWFESQFQLKPEPLSPEGPGCSYVKLLEEMAVNDPPAYLCHYYNHYFAHTAGGKMIGSKVSSMILDNVVLDFYKWDGVLVDLQTPVRKNINDMALTWSPEEKQKALDATPGSFQYSGSLMKCMTEME